MLSYMVPSPIEDKPPVAPVVSNKNGLQLVLDTHLSRNGGISASPNGGIPNGNANSCQKKIIKNGNVASAASSNSSLNSNADIPAVHASTTVTCGEKAKTRIANGSTKQTSLKR